MVHVFNICLKNSFFEKRVSTCIVLFRIRIGVLQKYFMFYFLIFNISKNDKNSIKVFWWPLTYRENDYQWVSLNENFSFPIFCFQSCLFLLFQHGCCSWFLLLLMFFFFALRIASYSNIKAQYQHLYPLNSHIYIFIFILHTFSITLTATILNICHINHKVSTTTTDKNKM